MIGSQNSESYIVDYIPQLGLGLRIDCDPQNYIDRFVLSNGFWEPFVLSAIRLLLRQGDVCVDVGANAGYISMVMGSLVGASGRVLSFEPNIDVLDKFSRNIALNPNLKDVVELLTVGLGRESKEMYVAPDLGVGMGNATLVASASEGTTHEVCIKTLDSFELPRLDCLKVDVEGMEIEVLSGAEETIRRCHPHIIFETLTAHPPEFHKPLEEFVRDLGYRTYALNLEDARFEEITYPYFPQEDTYAIHPSRLR
jgi:FkbM family methyltransferase